MRLRRMDTVEEVEPERLGRWNEVFGEWQWFVPIVSTGEDAFTYRFESDLETKWWLEENLFRGQFSEAGWKARNEEVNRVRFINNMGGYVS